MKKTLLLAYLFPPSTGGVQRYLFELAKRMPAGSLVVFARDFSDMRSEQAQLDRDFPHPIIRVAMDDGRGIPLWLRLRRSVIEAISTHNIEQVLCSEVLPMGMVGTLSPVPFSVFTYARDVVMPKKSALKHVMAKRVFARAKHIITISEFTKSLLLDYGDVSDRISFVRPGVDPDFFDPKRGSGDIADRFDLHDKKVILSIGRMDPRKGFDTMIACMPRVREQVPNAIYLIVGDGEDKHRLRALAKRHGVEDIVRFAPDRIEDDQLPHLYNACDVFITLSRYDRDSENVEGFGIVFLEANACEKPVVAGYSGGTPDAVDHERTGFLVDPLNHDEIASAVSSLLIDPNKAKTFGKQGRSRVLSTFTWDVQAKQLMDVLSS
jgi:phosphatidyl-myo-inositol dimannoside synthase